MNDNVEGVDRSVKDLVNLTNTSDRLIKRKEEQTERAYLKYLCSPETEACIALMCRRCSGGSISSVALLQYTIHHHTFSARRLSQFVICDNT